MLQNLGLILNATETTEGRWRGEVTSNLNFRKTLVAARTINVNVQDFVLVRVRFDLHTGLSGNKTVAWAARDSPPHLGGVSEAQGNRAGAARGRGRGLGTGGGGSGEEPLAQRSPSPRRGPPCALPGSNFPPAAGARRTRGQATLAHQKMVPNFIFLQSSVKSSKRTLSIS